jgi:hypothetical protein
MLLRPASINKFKVLRLPHRAPRRIDPPEAGASPHGMNRSLHPDLTNLAATVPTYGGGSSDCSKAAGRLAAILKKLRRCRARRVESQTPNETFARTIRLINAQGSLLLASLCVAE